MKQVVVENVTKVYKKYRKPYHVVLEKARLIKPVETVKAIDDVSLSIDRGESVALIGTNGAGKTSLLKMILGISKQTSGTIVINGKMVAMMVIGMGMHDLFSGAYNINLFGTVLGMSQQEINRKFDDIVSFAGLEKYVHMPLRTYSRGMRVRLAFSVMMFVETDGYVIDETLAFSDLPFQKLCVQKLKEIRKKGSTLVVASHDIPLMKSLSDRVIWMRNGSVVEDGPCLEVLEKYEHSFDFSTMTKD